MSPWKNQSAAPPSAAARTNPRATSLTFNPISRASRSRARKARNQLNMRRPEELVYRGNGSCPIAARDQQGGIAGKTGGVAGHVSDHRHFGAGQGLDLGLGARAGRVENHCVERVQ